MKPTADSCVIPAQAGILQKEGLVPFRQRRVVPVPFLPWLQCAAAIATVMFALAILFPIASLARTGGKSTLCLANLHILGHAWLAYQEDNNGKLVNGLVPRDASYANLSIWLAQGYKDNAWWVNPPIKNDGTYADGGQFPCLLTDEDNGIRSGKLYPYVGISAPYHCPSDLSYLKPINRGGKRSYSITAAMHGENPKNQDYADLYSQIVRPYAKMVFIENYDSRGWNMGSWMMSYSPPSWIDTIPVFHDRRSALGFADGHGELHPWVSLDSRTGQPNSAIDLNYLASIYLPKR